MGIWSGMELLQYIPRNLDVLPFAPDLSYYRYHPVRVGCVQRIFRARLQAATQEEERQTGQIQARYKYDMPEKVPFFMLTPSHY